MENEDQIEDVELELSDEDESDGVDWKAEALKYKASAQRYRKQAAKKPEVQAPDTSAIDAKLERLELKTDGYNDEAINFIQSNGGKKALENEYVVAAVKAIQEQKKAEAAIVGNESAKSDFERKHTPEEIANMSPEELYKLLPKASR